MRPKLYLQRLENFNIAQKCRTQIGTHPFPKRLKRVCLIVTQRPLGQSPKEANSTLLKCHSTLQKCKMGSWTPNALPCSGTFWTLLLGFFDRSLHLDVFSSFVYDFFFISFLDNSGFLKNNYLVDKSLKINLDNVQIIPNFVVIQSSILFLCMHPYFKY